MSTLDISKYRRVNVPLVKQWIDRRGLEQLEQTIAELSLSTGCHIIAICTFIGELYGMTPALAESLQSKMVFYQYKEVIG